MEIFYVLGTYPTLLENMVAKVYEASAPTAEINSIIIPEKNISGVITPGAGHQVNQNVTFTGLDRLPHILKLFTLSGTQLQEFNIQPTGNVVTLFDPINFKIGDGAVNTPAAGTRSYINTLLAGATDILLFRNGTLFYGRTVSPSGGFDLSDIRDRFETGEPFTVIRKPEPVTVYVNDSVVGKQWGPTTGNANMFVDVVSTVSYSPTHLRKLIRLSGIGIYNFNTAVPVGYIFRFSNQAGGNGIINFTTAPLITILGNITSYTLPAGAIVEFVFDGQKFNKTFETVSTNAAYSITYKNFIAIGNLVYSAQFTVAIPDQGTTDYTILGAMRSVNGANWYEDNTTIWTISSKATNSFVFAAGEVSGYNQNLIFDFVIIKAN